MINISLVVLLLASCVTQQVPEKVTTIIAEPVVIRVADKNFPSEVLDLTNWKLNTPTDTQTSGKVDEYKQPVLNTFIDANWFHLNNSKDGVVFKANTGGVTTSGSGYPRSELREMINSGNTNASWGSASGIHTMFIEQAITHLPNVKPHIVIGQIHDADHDIVVFRLEKKKLFIDLNGKDGPVLDNNYSLGKHFTVMFKVHDNKVDCYYNDALVYSHNAIFSNAYFKAGAYVQSSCKGTRKVIDESCDAYGEVEIYKLRVEHD
ncbi:polyguluronate lyase precursor [Arcticibacter svalbardensis MN12-7]|uniref:Polyguluronate lyase n=1 Tax=Arcticibacter svalbardensis MN12-7 TaxID=1150600 RepID=R9H0X4_9SPHI|nr:polysaccharide lyase family 7 protein [Arcticibacter svalbardensis]EOR94889.1 polyguluronate lyase precursor [Arcticibacter svalbardensis MN12-7]